MSNGYYSILMILISNNSNLMAIISMPRKSMIQYLVMTMAKTIVEILTAII